MDDLDILILGGTGEARALADRLARRPEFRVTLSLAGRTQAPLRAACALRVGGFGGAEGLARHLVAEGVGLLVDATHPFARRISANARQAAEATGVPLLRLTRPAWEPVAGDLWIPVPDIGAAVAALGPAPSRILLAIGRQEVAAFKAAPQHHYLVRSVEPVAPCDLPATCETLLARGPFAEADEARLLTEQRIELIVAKNSGGAATYGKIAAARALGLPVVMIARTEGPGALASVDELEARILHVAGLAKRGV